MWMQDLALEHLGSEVVFVWRRLALADTLRTARGFERFPMSIPVRIGYRLQSTIEAKHP